MPTVLGEVFLRVINDLVRTYRAHRVQFPGAVHASHFSPEGFGNLHRERAHTTACTIDQDTLPWLNLSLVAKSLEGEDCGLGCGRRLRKGQAVRFGANALSGTDTYSAKPPHPHPDTSPNTSSPG